MIGAEAVGQRLARLCAALPDDADLDMKADGWWRQAFEAVPRHLFAPARTWVVPDGDNDGYGVDRDSDGPAWLDAVYSDASLISQIDDGAGDPATGDGMFTSSLSAPGTVAVNLTALGLRKRDRVLEVGTGSAWSCCLTCWRVGEGNVTSIEVDPTLAKLAKANAAAAGYAPDLRLGDGLAGAPDRAPFDKVHATCATTAIPPAWVAQTRPGGRIVTPWTTGYGDGLLAVLTVTDDGRAIGAFNGFASYMLLRSQRLAVGPASSFVHHLDQAAQATTRVDPRALAGDSYGADLAIGVLAPGVHYWLEDLEAGAARLWLRETTLDAKISGSWACVDYYPGSQDYSVSFYGQRDLWREVTNAYFTWVGWGRPGVSRFGMTVSAATATTRVWLDSPANIIGR